MQKIKNFIISNYAEILTVTSLFIIFLLLFFIFGNHVKHIIVDFSREAYFPQEVLKGKILYKDIFNLFGPLSYQLNAFLYMIFGVKISTLLFAGAINTLIIVFSLYALARLFTSREISWLITVFIMCTCVFNTRAFSYIAPYSYAMVYELSAFLISLLFLMIYLKTSKQFFIPLSWFFIGISFALKYEYVLYITFLVLFTLVLKYYKKIDLKCILYSAIAFLIVPLISYSALFFQGLTFKELVYQAKLAVKFGASPTLHYFYSHSAGVYPLKENLIYSFGYFKQIFPSFVIFLTAIYFSMKFNKFTLSLILVSFLFCTLFPQILHSPFLIFSVLPLLTLLSFGFMFFNLLKEKKYSYEITYGIFLFLALIVSVESFLFSNFYPYSIICAFNIFLFSVLSLILYFVTSKKIFIPLSWFFIGFAAAVRYEYIFYLVILIPVMILITKYKKLETKYVLYSLISFLPMPIIANVISLEEVFNQIRIFERFSTSPFINWFYSSSPKLYVRGNDLTSIFSYFKQVFLSYTNLILLALYAFYLLSNFMKIRSKEFNNAVLSSFFIGILFYNIFYNNFIKEPLFCLSWLPLFELVIFFIILIRLIFNKNPKDGIFVLFFAAALISTIKVFFFLNLLVYGTFNLPILFIAISIFVVEYLPSWFTFIDKEYLSRAFLIIVFGITLITLTRLLIYQNIYSAFVTDKGTFYNDKTTAIPVEQTIKYIKNNLKPDDSLWVLPEGIIINFLTDHPSNGIYYSILPPYIETFGEDKIISDTKKNSPDYILINNRWTIDHGLPYLCEDYGFKICKYVKSSYKPVAKFGKGFKIVIYKRREVL